MMKIIGFGFSISVATLLAVFSNIQPEISSVIQRQAKVSVATPAPKINLAKIQGVSSGQRRIPNFRNVKFATREEEQENAIANDARPNVFVNGKFANGRLEYVEF